MPWLLFQLLAVVDTKQVVQLLQAWQTLLEVIKVLLLWITPLDLAGSTKSGQKLIESMLGICNVLSPQIYLGTKDESLLLIGKAIWYKRLERIYLAGRYNIAVCSAWLLAKILQLRIYVLRKIIDTLIDSF